MKRFAALGTLAAVLVLATSAARANTPTTLALANQAGGVAVSDHGYHHGGHHGGHYQRHNGVYLGLRPVYAPPPPVVVPAPACNAYPPAYYYAPPAYYYAPPPAASIYYRSPGVSVGLRF